MSDTPMQPRSIAVPAEMDPAAIKFVCKFAEAMAIELHQAQLQDSHHSSDPRPMESTSTSVARA